MMLIFHARYLSRSSVYMGFRVPKELVRDPRHKSFKFTGHQVGSLYSDFNNIITKNRHPKKFVRPIIENFWLAVGDYVQIMKGKDAKKDGYVVQIVPENGWIYVGGLNCYYSKPRSDAQDAPMKISEAPLLISDVCLIDPKDRLPTTIQWKYSSAGEKVRVSMRTGAIIPWPALDPKVNEDQPWDTSPEDASRVTFSMPLKTFEQDILDKMGIQDKRKKRRTWWY